MFGKCVFRLLAFGDWEPMLLVLSIFWSFGRLMPAAPVHKADRETAAPSATMQNGISLMPEAPGHKADRVTIVLPATMQNGMSHCSAASASTERLLRTATPMRHRLRLEG